MSECMEYLSKTSSRRTLKYTSLPLNKLKTIRPGFRLSKRDKRSASPRTRRSLRAKIRRLKRIRNQRRRSMILTWNEEARLTTLVLGLDLILVILMKNNLLSRRLIILHLKTSNSFSKEVSWKMWPCQLRSKNYRKSGTLRISRSFNHSLENIWPKSSTNAWCSIIYVVSSWSMIQILPWLQWRHARLSWLSTLITETTKAIKK